MGKRPKRFVILLTGVLALAIIVGCDDDDNDADTGPTVNDILVPAHEGFGVFDCVSCHENYASAPITTCSQCHGGNGACDPHASERPDDHSADDPCADCHELEHDLAPDDNCAACHFSKEGVVPCE